MGGKSSKKIGKIVLWVLLGLLAVDLLAVGLLFVPAIQTFAVNKVTRGISDNWGTELSIKDVRLSPSLRLIAHGVRIHDNHHNDMIYVGKVNGRLKSITIKPFKLRLGTVTLEDANVVIRKYEGDTSVNISIWAQKFPSPEVRPIFLLTAQHLNMVNSRFVYVNDHEREVFDVSGNPPVDFAYFELKDINWEVNDFIVLNDSVAANFKHLSFNQYSGFRMKDGQGSFSICDHELRFDGLKVISEKSVVDADLLFSYNNWYNYADFLDSVRITAAVRPTILNMSDVADFVGALRGMSETLLLGADRMDGCVNNFEIINLTANCGYSNRIRGDLALRNITDLSKAYLNVQLDSCKVDVPSLALLTLPKGKKLSVNKNIAELGQTSFGVSFIGTLTNFNTDLHAHTESGTLAASLSSLVSDGGMRLQGKADANGLNLAKLTHAHKALGGADGSFTFEGGMDGTGWDAANLKTLQGNIDGHVSGIDLYGYHLRNTSVSGEYQDKMYTVNIASDDPHLKCDVQAQLDRTGKEPVLQGNVTIGHGGWGVIANAMPPRDSATAKGLDKLIYTIQRNPTLEAGFDNLSFNLMGRDIDHISGYVGCDNIRVYNNGDSLSDCRFRVTSINTDIAHKFIVSSNIANASLETNRPVAEALDSIRALAAGHFPGLLSGPGRGGPQPDGQAADDFYLKAQVCTYRTYNVLKLIFPDILIAPNSTLDLALSSSERDNTVRADIPFFIIRDKLRLFHLTLDGHSLDGRRLELNGGADSLIIGKRDSKIQFKGIALGARSDRDSLHYDLSWHNSFGKRDEESSRVAGVASLTNAEDFEFHLRNTNLCLNGMNWVFNDANTLHLNREYFTVDNLAIRNQDSRLSVSGDYSFDKTPSDLNVKAEAIDLSIVNPLLANMSCGGLLSADLHLRNGTRRLLLGKALADNFVFNDEEIGDLFVIAGWNDAGNIGFNGGFFRNDEVVTAGTLSAYDVRQFQQEENIFARLRGVFETSTRRLAVHTVFDTLNAGFLNPFLSGFSDHIRGTASGILSFYSSPDSTYFDGNVRVVDANMGIAALGTSYNVVDQDIRFNAEGIFFDKMEIHDTEGNRGFLQGSIRHKMFRDMAFDLKVSTPGIQVLNTPKAPDISFYGKGYASGEVTITGTEKRLLFRGQNLETLEGTRLYLLVSSASSASESNSIRFKSSTARDTILADSKKSSMELDFDFTFNVTDAADIILQLESIGGTLNARANGNFRLSYNDLDDLNLYGNLQLHSGDFRFSLYNIVNSRFTLVPGGSITFDGPLDNMVVHASAFKSSKTSLANIVPQEYLASTASSNVHAYLHLNGEIMKNIEPTFSFDLPNSSPEVRNIFFNAIDTTNTENITKQFAYFMVTNNFLPNNLFSNNTTGGNYNMLSNLINNTLGNLMDSRKGSFGVIYNQASESTFAEYGIKANANLLEERVSLSTSIGYYDDKSTSATNNLYGDFTIEYNINRAGTWKLKAYTYVGEHDETYYNPDVNSQINYTAGVALAYKQNFDSRSRRKMRMAAEPKSKSKSKKKNEGMMENGVVKP